MITITGTIHDFTSASVTDRKTGEISMVYTAEVLHKSRGKSEIAALKLDASVFDEWSKHKGKQFSAEVRFYAMKGSEGAIISGLTLADKKSLPVLLSDSSSPQPTKQAPAAVAR